MTKLNDKKQGWEKEFEKVFYPGLHKQILPKKWLEEFKKTRIKREKDFIRSLLSHQRTVVVEQIRERVSKMKKNTSVIAQAELVMATPKKGYSLMQFRSAVKGYNKSIDDILTLLGEVEKEEI